MTTRPFPPLPALPDAPAVRNAVAAITACYAAGLSWPGEAPARTARINAACKAADAALEKCERAGYPEAAQALSEWHAENI
jgi:hypothetical protein